MQFLTVKDESGIERKILVVRLNENEMNAISGQCAKCMPSISISSLMQLGHPYVIIDFGGGDAWKTAIALDEKSEDGHKIGDELAVGDTVTVILTSKSNAVNASKDQVLVNAPLEEILAFTFLYTADMAANYALFKMYKQPRAE